MSEKKISYLDRTFEDYRNSLYNYIKQYYPEIAETMDDASIGSWIIDIVAATSDNLSYHIDRVFNETHIDSASAKSSVYAMARNNGFKIPGPKPSVAEVELSCELPVYTSKNNKNSSLGMPNYAYAPIFKKGTSFTNGTQIFELVDNVDFSEQFNADGYSDRKVVPNTDKNGNIVSYTVSKFPLVIAGESKIYQQVISASDITPFMEIVLPDKNILSVESILFKDDVSFSDKPSIGEFMNPNEFIPAQKSPSNNDTYRYFEVNSLSEQYRWGDDIDNTLEGNQNIPQPKTYTYGYYDNGENTIVPTKSVTKGAWVPLTQKFITEYTDNGYLKIIFGTGEQHGQSVDFSKANDFSKNQITRMIRNNFLGKLPKQGWTMFVLYRVGGGLASNVPAKSINTILTLNCSINQYTFDKDEQKIIGAIKDSFKVTNTIPSVAGKDAPSVDEIKYMMKYNNSAQERCVTLKDYESRVMSMPQRYGCPFRVRAIEANNKIMLYLLDVNNNGQLEDAIPQQLAKNIENYLTMYRNINDFVEIKSGRIINVSFDVDLYIDKTYVTNDVVYNVINTIRDYMDVNKHQLGEDIYISDMEKEVSKVDGVLNLIDFRVYNEYGDGYSKVVTSQGGVYQNPLDGNDMPETDRMEIDIESTDYILNSEPDEMFEIKYPNKDIRIRVKTR